MSRVHGFPPLADAQAMILILGSMPGRASLLAGEYYAHPRNAFWRIIEAIYAIDHTLPYPARCAGLVAERVAVWDVLRACNRPGSLDADIDASTVEANDFPRFFAKHPAIGAIFFNGAMAESTFRRHVLPRLPSPLLTLPRIRLPSTSPANASYSFERKLASWRAIV